MRAVLPLTADSDATREEIGGKAHGLLELLRLGLPVPPGFVIGTATARVYPAGGTRALISHQIAALEGATGRRFDGAEPLAVSVRSGAAVSMPGMLTTVLGVGVPAEAAGWRRRLAAGLGMSEMDIPAAPVEQLDLAVRTVLASWRAPRAVTYRTLHGIPDDPGTAVVVQVLVFGDRDEHSASGVALSRNPHTGAPGPYGEVLLGAPGEDLVSGRVSVRPLADLATVAPTAAADLAAALRRVEAHRGEVCEVEFTVEAGRLWLLQLRTAVLAGRAAIRAAVDLADEGVIDRPTALLRITAADLRAAATPRLAAGADVLAAGLGACPGIAAGRLATTSTAAVSMAASGPVILARPQTSPLDLAGIAAAAGLVTARGGATSHAAVVARSLGRPAVVGAAGLDVADGALLVGGRALDEGTVLTVDGAAGLVVLGDWPVETGTADEQLDRLLGWADEVSGGAVGSAEARLAAAHAVLG